MRQRLNEYEDHDRSPGLVADERIDDYAEPRRRIPTAVLTLVVMIVFAGGLWFAYSQGSKQGGSGGAQSGNVPLIRADGNPTKIKPDQPGGMEVPDRDKLVFSDKTGGPQVEKLLPPAEQPAPRPVGPPPQAAPPPIPSLPSAGGGVPFPVAEPAKPVKPAPQSQVAAAAPKAPAKPVAEVKPAAEAKPPAAAKPQPVAAPAPAPVAAPAPASAPGSAGGIRLQLASVRSAEAARDEWNRIKGANADLLGNVSAVAVRADLGEKGVYYRVQAGPFADGAAADKLCGQLKKRQLGCSVVR